MGIQPRPPVHKLLQINTLNNTVKCMCTSSEGGCRHPAAQPGPPGGRNPARAVIFLSTAPQQP